MNKRLILVFVLGLLALACQAVIPPTATPTASVSSVTQVEAATSTPRPAPEPITCSDDTCLNACLDRIQRVLSQDALDPIGGEYAGADVELNLVYYEVQDGQLGEPQVLYAPKEFQAYQQDTEAHQRVWKYASAMLPPNQLKWIVKYEIFSSSYYAAWVGAEGEDRSKWTLGVDIEDAQDPVSLTIILVHEFAHMLTLNAEQIPLSEYYYGWKQNTSACAQFLSPDGCSTPTSYINLFYQAFWKDVFDDWYEIVDKPQVNTSEERRALVQDFYDLHSEQFIREYAATNIYEDLAESFQHFVLDPKPTGDSVVEQKILFFYDFPELVTIRQQMIQNMCSYAQ